MSESIKVDHRAPNFPAKSWGLSRLLADEEELAAQEEQRQQALQSWFDYYLDQGSLFADYGKFLLFFEVSRQQKLQGGEGGCEARTGVAPDVTLHEGALRTDATVTCNHDSSVAAADSKDRSNSVERIHNSEVARDRSASFASHEGKSGSAGKAAAERDCGAAGITDSDDFTTEGGGSVMATPQKQRLCEEDDPDIANLMLYTPDSSEKGAGADFDAIPGSMSLFQGFDGRAAEGSSYGTATGGTLYDSDRFNSGASIATNSSLAHAQTHTPRHVRAIGSRVPLQTPDVSVSVFTAPRIVNTSVFCGWSSLWGGKGENAKSSRTPSPQSVGSIARSGADALLNLWGSSERWLAILQLNWRTESQKSELRSLWRRGIPPYVRGKVWKKAIGNKLSIDAQLYEYNRHQARVIFYQETDTAISSATTTQMSSGSGSFRSSSPWVVQEHRSSSAQQFTTRGATEFTSKEQGRSMRRNSSSGLLLDHGNTDGSDQAIWFDWAISSGATGATLSCSNSNISCLTSMSLRWSRDRFRRRANASLNI